MRKRYEPWRYLGLRAVEWVILIVVLGISSVIMVPVIMKAREPEWKPNCQGNLKELAGALTLYVEDNGGHFPSASGKTDDILFETQLKKTVVGARATTWAGAVQPYVKHGGAYYCPADKEAGGPSISYYYKHAAHMATKAGFGKDWFMRPAKQVVLYERGDFHHGGDMIKEGSRVNVAFVDGHVRTVQMVNVAPDKEPMYFNAIDRKKPGAREVKPPYWDPRYCYDRLR